MSGIVAGGTVNYEINSIVLVTMVTQCGIFPHLSLNKITNIAFWIVKPCGVVGAYHLQDYMASQPIRLQSASSPSENIKSQIYKCY
jgi:hypothetical protein